MRNEDDYEFLVEFCAGEYGDVKGTLEEIKKQSTKKFEVFLIYEK